MLVKPIVVVSIVLVRTVEDTRGVLVNTVLVKTVVGIFVLVKPIVVVSIVLVRTVEDTRGVLVNTELVKTVVGI